MEFNEKLQELRKNRGLTQEELAEALFVSRTAVSKWESGRGYPSIDSLKAISRFFSVTIDELICSEEMVSVAEEEKKTFASQYAALICSALDVFPAILLFLPVFGNGVDQPVQTSLFCLTGVQPWLKIVFAVVIGLTIINGLCGVILTRFDRPVWSRRGLTAGMILSIAAVAVFIGARQPYAGIVFFALLVLKEALMKAVPPRFLH